MAKRRKRASNDVVRQAVENSLKPIQDVIDGIEKDFGKGSIMPLDSSVAACANHPSISSGALSLDRALGIWGYPRGRIIEVYGPEASGKTTLALHAVAEAQKAGGYAAFVDAEHALDSEYAKNLGVDTSLLLISQPDHGEQGLEIAEKLITSNRLDIVVIDSVAALVPRAEIEGDMGDSHMALQARLMSQAMRKLTGIISRTNTILMFINQIRHKIGVMFGNPETTTGGNALKFYASQRLDIRRIGAIKHGDSVIGNRTRIKVVKNKMAPPLKFTEVDIIYGQGISRISDLIDLGAQIGIIEKAGAWYSYDGERIGQGKENTRRYLLTNKDLANEIYKIVKECLMKESGK